MNARIDQVATAPQARLPVRNPRTGACDAFVPVASAAEVAATAARLRAAQRAWARRPVAERGAALSRWADELAVEREALVDALFADTGRWGISVGEVDGALRNLRRWASQAPGLVTETEFPSALLPTVTIRDQYVPYPLVGCISPWNFPVTLSLIDAVPALVAGCAVIVKPSEVTPRFVGPLRRALARVPELAAVLEFVTGAADTGRALVSGVDAVCFTGSVATGRKVAEAAAARFIPAFLELGGKDPAIVLASADLEMATDVVLRGSIANNGHACMSLERVYVQRPVYAPFVERLVEKARAVRLAYPDPRSGYLGPLIFEPQARVIQAQLDDARARGARVLCGGEIENLGGGLYLRPTVVVDVDHTMTLLTEETFGPVIPVMPFDTAQQAIDLANDSEYGLSACVLAGTLDEALAVGREIDAGGISLNDGCMTYMTYEGEKNSFKYSGLGGSRMGAAGLRRFFRKKALIQQHGRAAGVPAH
ncbi:MAG: aldehyde dehydrogenase family protein [Steroidobacteraceae bacterium]|jgi:acyl-CoA reductase-like NAD-dependent aldehyde dehydrogenase|nr:aldehyde dehydrogenase family protein [Steroidobacteraceae bacterium]